MDVVFVVGAVAVVFLLLTLVSVLDRPMAQRDVDAQRLLARSGCGEGVGAVTRPLMPSTRQSRPLPRI